MDVNSDGLEMVVVEAGCVDRGVFHAVVNEDGEAATASITRTVSTEQGVVEERRVRNMWTQFCFL